MFLKPTSGLYDKGGRIALNVTTMADGTMMRSLIDRDCFFFFVFGPIGEVQSKNTKGQKKWACLFVV